MMYGLYLNIYIYKYLKWSGIRSCVCHVEKQGEGGEHECTETFRVNGTWITIRIEAEKKPVNANANANYNNCNGAPADAGERGERQNIAEVLQQNITNKPIWILKFSHYSCSIFFVALLFRYVAIAAALAILFSSLPIPRLLLSTHWFCDHHHEESMERQCEVGVRERVCIR